MLGIARLRVTLDRLGTELKAMTSVILCPAPRRGMLISER